MKPPALKLRLAQAEHASAASARARSASPPTRTCTAASASAAVPPAGARFQNRRPEGNAGGALHYACIRQEVAFSVCANAMPRFSWQGMIHFMKKVELEVLTHHLANQLALMATCIAGCCCIPNLTAVSHL